MWKYNSITELNFSLEELLEERMKVIKQWFGKVDSYVFIEPPFYCDYGYNISMGKFVYMNHNCVILDVNTVEIGANTMFGPHCQLLSATHLPEPETRMKGLELGLPIKIGENCWVGGGVIICPDITIGDHVTIGAGSVVTKNLPDNVIAVGNPCKVIKKL
jgi:maltose O-acetyltransferase